MRARQSGGVVFLQDHLQRCTRHDWAEQRREDVVADGLHRTDDFPSVLELYGRGEYGLHADLRVGAGRVDADLTNYCAWFQATPQAHRDDFHNLTVDLLYDVELRPDWHHDRRIEVSVLVDDVEVVQLLDGMPSGTVPSMVWLRGFDDALMSHSDGLERPARVGLIRTIPPRRPEDGEYGLLAALLPVHDGKPVHEVIEGGPEIVDAVAEDNGHVDGHRGDSRECQSVVRGIRVEIGVDSYRVTLALNQRAQLSKVEMRPVELVHRAGKWIGHDA